MKDSFTAISNMGRGNGCYTTDVDSEQGFFQQRRGLTLWYRLLVKVEQWQ
jgi:hypothetical protein